ncbi:MAG: hypothetical protein FK730_11415 [Asgard group archaeon]|nr:hypothetical protein [Asgard group archaeon]
MRVVITEGLVKTLSLRDKFPKLSTRGIITLVAIVILAGSFIGIFAWIRVNQQYSYGYIVIKKDSDFTKRYGFLGSGTEVDPYRIENLTINNQINYGILIYETTSHFIIRNCTIKGNPGIFINEIASGTCKIVNNTIEVLPDSYGIGLGKTSNAIVENNILFAENTSSLVGITVFSSPNAKITKNNCTNLGRGIEVWGISNNAEVSLNDCSNCFIGIEINAQDWYEYPNGWTDASMQDLKIEDNNCNNNSFGIYALSELSSSDIDNNNCSFNSMSGLEIYGCYDLTISNNFILNNTQGISFVDVRDSLITMNLIKFNRDYGINITDSTGIEVYSNNFIENNLVGQISGETQAYDNNPTDNPAGENYWNIPAGPTGNYWSELLWNPTAYYEIDGENNVDYYPVENPITIT